MELEINLVLVVSDPAFPIPTTVTLHHLTLLPTVLTYKYGLKCI